MDADEIGVPLIAPSHRISSLYLLLSLLLLS